MTGQMVLLAPRHDGFGPINRLLPNRLGLLSSSGTDNAECTGPLAHRTVRQVLN